LVIAKARQKQVVCEEDMSLPESGWGPEDVTEPPHEASAFGT
jgi:hypothetical protein